MSYSRVFKLARIFPECLLALFAYEGHVKRLHERMVALLLVAFCAVVPLLACPFSAFIQCFFPPANVQQGERMATWALRTCLLHARQPAAEVTAGVSEGARAYHMADR
jgi:hypothetical protein